MVDLAKEAFCTNNFSLAADIYERTIRENGPTSELFLGLADSLARTGLFAKAFESYTNAYRYGKVTPEKLKHLVIGLIDTVKQDISNSGNTPACKNCMFTCGSCRGLLVDPVTIPCGHTFCRKCLERDVSKTCDICNIVHYRLKVKQISSNVILSNLIEKWFPNECKATQLKKKGNELIAKMEFKNAVTVYTQAIQMAPCDHLLLSNRCHAYASLDKFQEALTDAELVVKLRPDWPKGYFRRGRALYGLGHYEDAAVAFLQCLALDQKVSTAKEYLSKALDKILSVLPPDDPKAHALHQRDNPTMLQQLLESNFSQKSLLLPEADIHSTFTDLAKIVRDTITTANSFSSEPRPNSSRSTEQQKEEKSSFPEGATASTFTAPSQTEGLIGHMLTKYNSMPDCSEVDHLELEKKTLPRTHSPQSRKRSRVPSAPQCPVSPSHSSPNKVLKGFVRTTAARNTPSVSQGATPTAATALSSSEAATQARSKDSSLEPERTDIEDLECGLCYRLFFEPYLAERRKSVTYAVQSIMEMYFSAEYAERCRINDEEMVELARMGSEQQSEIPVFVCTLAFPTIACPLHIFEPRYRLMVRQCMESGTRQFGMCMYTNDDDGFSDYGVMLEIRDVQYFPDGRSVVDTIGGRRFKVISRGKRDGYHTAKVEFILDTVMEPQDVQTVNELQTKLHASISNWLSKLPSINQTRITQHFGPLPPLDGQLSGYNGPKWAWWAVAVLPLDQRVQMAMLRMASLKDRLVALDKVLNYMNRRNSR
ncbi:LON peptidase N-terminal domain and RING finger protein 3-like [Elysia marginata]|uniref:LON peptidase N-terminal domain and RING finger protein 3-like n=1 Tax=Elysia marginata TaxID=1093978 RepID=A0AAV4F5C7_9GAST|nr:LON peptidase N-terminal domain and RING finger protein 3-like [Elysia marginata]